MSARRAICHLLCGASISLLFLVPPAAAREWVDASGKFRVEAELVAVRNGKAILEKPDGSVISIPVDKLSSADQAFLKNQGTPAPATTIPATTIPATTIPATTAPAPSIPATPVTAEGAALALKVQGVLKTNCYRCHGEEGASEGGFNFVLNLEKLAKTVVQPRNAAASTLWERISAGDDSVMPPVGETPRPSADDLAVIKAWIDAGAPAAVAQPPREFITNEQIWKYIRADVDKYQERSRRFLRYFSLTHLWNAGVSEDEIQTYRNAFVKLLNSLSWNTSLVVPVAVDPHRTILRIDFRQVNWNTQIWEQIEQANPYSLTFTFPDAKACYELTECQMPLVRVDWLVFAASKPPLYHSVLAVPTSDGELESSLKVNVQANIDQEQAIRAAFNRSGVSQNNRLIEWHKSPYGSYWKSYDFGGNTDRQNLFGYPLGPGGNDGFQHDGGEIIFTLPNGLQGYLLVDAAGKRIDAGPTNIVSDPKRGDKTVTNGVSCMSCHYTGVIPKTDEVGPAVRANPKAFENSADILALYRDPKELNAIFEADAKRFAEALEKLGISSLSRSGEPISAMALRFEQELDLRLAACELGLSVAEFEKRLDGAETTARMLAPLRAPGGTVKRDMFANIFNQAALELKVVHEASVNIGFSASITPRPPAVQPAAPAVASSDRSPRSSRSSRGGGEMPAAPQVEFGGNKPGEVRRFGDLGWGVDSLAFAPGGAMLAAGKSDDALLLFDVVNNGRLDFLDKLKLLGKVSACIFTPNGSRLLAGGQTGQIAIYDVSRDGRLTEAGQFVGHSKEIKCMAVSSDSRFALSGSMEEKARLWEIATGREQAVFAGFQGGVKAVHIARNGRTGMATDGETLLFIDLIRKEVSRTRRLSSSRVSQAAAFSADGSHVAVCDGSKIVLANVNNVSEFPPLDDNEMQWSVAFTPDGSRIISGGSGKVNVWEVKSKRKIASLPTAGSYYVQCLATSPDNKHAAAIPGSSSQDLQVFRLPHAER
jgi:WD40 repeat protein